MIVPFLAGLAVGIVICLIFVSWLLGSMTPVVDGAHTPDDDIEDFDDDSDWMISEALLRTGSHQ